MFIVACMMHMSVSTQTQYSYVQYCTGTRYTPSKMHLAVLLLMCSLSSTCTSVVDGFFVVPATTTPYCTLFSRPSKANVLLSGSLLIFNSASSFPLSESEKDRLLLGEDGLCAFIAAEMRHFINETMVGFDQGLVYGSKWSMPLEEKKRFGLLDGSDEEINHHEEYIEATKTFAAEGGGDLAVDLIVQTTELAFREGWQQTGLLSALGSAILFFRNYYFETPTLIAACERIGLNDYTIAHHITDMYHHRSFRGAYTKTLAPSGKGEIAARIAVGLVPDPSLSTANTSAGSSNPSKQPSPAMEKNEREEEEDECLVWSPTTPGVCLHWKSEDDAWRTRRFERIQMEGTRDPRRGGSGTSR